MPLATLCNFIWRYAMSSTWKTGHYFFLCLFLRSRFLRLCVDILCRLRFFPLGM